MSKLTYVIEEDSDSYAVYIDGVLNSVEPYPYPLIQNLFLSGRYNITEGIAVYADPDWFDDIDHDWPKNLSEVELIEDDD